MSRVVLVPGVLAMLPEYAGLEDPVAELRGACLAAVRSLDGPVEVVASPQGRRVAEALLDAAGVSTHSLALAARPPGPSYLVVGNGSARRTEKAPGHLDPRAATFDDELGRALLAPDPGALTAIDPELARDLWADTESVRRLGGLLTPEHVATLDHRADPFGVQYWVVRWQIPE